MPHWIGKFCKGPEKEAETLCTRNGAEGAALRQEGQRGPAAASCLLWSGPAASWPFSPNARGAQGDLEGRAGSSLGRRDILMKGEPTHSSESR